MWTQSGKRQAMRLMFAFVLFPLVGVGNVSGSEPATALAARMQRIQAAYFDLPAHTADRFSCELRIPELVASFDERARRAWGQGGHVVIEELGEGLRLRAAGLAQPSTAGLFNLGLAAWQLRLAAELHTVQAYLPSATLALVALAVTSPLTHETFEEPLDGGLRLGWRARGPDHGIQELAIETGPGWQIRSAYLLERDSSTIDLRLRNEKRSWSGGRWLVTRIDAEVRNRQGETERLVLDLDFQPLAGGPDVVLKRLRVLREDGEGRPIRKKGHEINPVTFEISRCARP